MIVQRRASRPTTTRPGLLASGLGLCSSWLSRDGLRFPRLVLVRNIFRDWHTHSLQQVISNFQRVRHYRERGIYCCAGGEEAAINDVQVVKIVSFAVGIERRCFWIVAEANCAVLMGHSREGDLLSHVEVAGEQA